MLDITPDIMTFLYQKYKEQNIDESLESFIIFSRNYLAKDNQPVNLAYLPIGIGLILQQGQTIGFIPQKVKTSEMRDEGIHVTRPQTIPGMRSITDTSGIHI